MDAEPDGILLVADGLSKSYGATQVLDRLSFTVSAGEFVSIIGPSGAGKTTLLRCLVGLLRPSGGSAVFEGRVVVEPPERMAMVFQDYSRSLMQWMTVEQNVTLPLEGKGVGRVERRERAAEALGAVGLADATEKRPWQLSGGMQQRVAIARALAYRPDLLVMDEPFASVDAQTRFDLEDLVIDLRRRLGVTVLFVTHDIDEAVYLSDRVVVLSRSPATVRETVIVELGPDRDQVTTKQNPLFGELRAHLLGLLRNGG